MVTQTRGGDASPAARAKATNAAGNLARIQGDYSGARARYKESLALAETLQDTQRIAVVLNNLGAVDKEQGDYAAARASYEQSLALKRELPSPWSVALTLSNLGAVQNAQADFAAARTSLGESLELFRELQDEWGIALAVNNLGLTAHGQNDYERATDLHGNSLAMRRRLRDRWGVAECLEGLASVARAIERHERSVRLLAAAAGIRETLSFPPPPDERSKREQEVETLRARLGEPAFGVSWATGHAMALDEACDYAVEPYRAAAPAVVMESAEPAAGKALSIQLLGGFRISVGGQEIPRDVWGRPQALAILQYLLLNRRRSVPAEEFVEVFWPGARSVDQSSLYTALSRIRRGLVRVRLDPKALQKDQTGYRLVLPTQVSVDLDAFEQGVHDAERMKASGRVHDVGSRLRETLLLYQGDLLADSPYSDWCALRREDLRRQFIEACLQLADLLEAERQTDEAIRYYAQALDHDPLREDAHRGLMRCYARTGRRELAVRQYRLCEKVLLEELDVRPSEITEALHEVIRRS